MTTDRDREEREARQGEWELQRRSSEVRPDEGYQAYPGVNLLEERDRQRQQLGWELREMDRRIEESEGYRISSRMSLLEKSYFIFDTNYLNLRHILEEFEQPMVFLKLWEERTRDRFDLFIDDVIRLFHNYLAGATTLLDHIDTLRDGLDGETRSSDEYQARWEEQLGEPALPSFMEDLLVYMLHQGLPFALAELNFGRIGSGVEVNSAIRLEVDKLKDWEHWSEKGREYLDTLEGKVKLDDVTREHAAIVASFYQWFVLRQSELHREALGELEELEEKRRDQSQRMRRLEDFLEAAETTASGIRQEREKLSKELEEERERRKQERARAEKLEADLERERNKGFWRRLFGR
ncbi:MAG: hypothetical protein LC751_01315 [Actinobacteria bacterium]|nr:hypothetical protein [Actinomycetota bacterium]